VIKTEHSVSFEVIQIQWEKEFSRFQISLFQDF